MCTTITWVQYVDCVQERTGIRLCALQNSGSARCALAAEQFYGRNCIDWPRFAWIWKHWDTPPLSNLKPLPSARKMSYLHLFLRRVVNIMEYTTCLSLSNWPTKLHVYTLQPSLAIVCQLLPSFEGKHYSKSLRYKTAISPTFWFQVEAHVLWVNQKII